MTEIQRLLTETIESLNTREKRDNKPRFSISFIRKHPGLFIGMYVAFFATLAVMLQSETLSGSVWLLVVLFILLNGFGNDSNLLIVFYVQIMPDDFVMQLHRF